MLFVATVIDQQQFTAEIAKSSQQFLGEPGDTRGQGFLV
jgi:hypothetical protein